MRIALLADIHGNSVALQAVLDDIQARDGVDGYWVMGDICALGYDPIGVLECLTSLPNMIAVKGNADRYATTLDLPPPTIDDALANQDKIAILMEVAGNFSWTRGALDATGWTSWLNELPFDRTLQLPDGTNVYLVHSQPHSDTGKGLNPTISDDEVSEMLSDIDAGLVCVGHFHLPLRRYFRDMQIVNPGSISNTFHDDNRAYYAILDASTRGFDIKFYAVTYDLDVAITKAHQTLNLGTGFNISAITGKISPSWKKIWDGSHFPPIEPEI